MRPEARLLVVDDNEATRYALNRRLTAQGFKVFEAGTGGDGLALVASVAPDAVILDVNLPDMSGFDVVRLLRAAPATALLPVVHVSAASIMKGDIITGLEAGADAYLVHPVDPDVLLATLRSLLRVRDAERALRESEARFREIFTGVRAPIAVIDTELNVQECNHAFAELVPGGLLASLSDDQAPGVNALRQHLERGERWQGSLVLGTNGQARETLWQVSPYRVPNLSLLFIEDITEHRHRERAHQAQLASANSQLALEVAERTQAQAQLLQSQKMDALGRLTGGIAHDFNNMLSGIITSVELIKRQLAQGRSDKLAVYADAALHSATSAASMTRRLLAFARQQPLDTCCIDVNQQLRALEQMLERSIGENITLVMDLAHGPLATVADAAQLDNAVLNLVINARDAMPEGGHIEIRTYPSWSQGDPALADGAYVNIAVKDNGTGIDPALLSKVFDPFFTTKPVGQGTGLGLSMLYGFTRQCGGTVNIRSAPGLGTEVTLQLPASEQVLAQPSQPAQAEPVGNGEHILVVEDTAAVRQSIVDALNDGGYHCSAVATAAEALQALSQGPAVDLLLTDIGLPGQNGMDLARQARALQAPPKVMFMTGYAENRMSRQQFADDGSDVLFKPFPIDELLRRVRARIDKVSDLVL
ncbi:response regulator [Pseudomonas sp. KNUC1026]|uniref:response regulator n=1 Tax=Pseudomonas sp. KNUC1026 TaxID=2893890 RepID=UPI001F2971FE|nr:response regulator [Pseudomonas sp. KNUC1026]UFH48678.1 response regulator [Pseudomonas sp. KNUC1026]